MRTRTPLLIPFLTLIVFSACEAPGPTMVEDQPTISPEFAKGDALPKPTIEVAWIYKDAFDNSPIPLSGVLASQNSRGNSETGLIPVTILGTAEMDFKTVFPILVTLGDGEGTAWEMDGHGLPLTEDTYRNDDGILDLIVHFNLRSMFDNGDIDLDTEFLCLEVTLEDGSTSESCQPVKVI